MGSQKCALLFFSPDQPFVSTFPQRSFTTGQIDIHSYRLKHLESSGPQNMWIIILICNDQGGLCFLSALVHLYGEHDINTSLMSFSVQVICPHF